MHKIALPFKKVLVAIGDAIIRARMAQVRKEMSLYQWNLRDYTKEIDKNGG